MKFQEKPYSPLDGHKYSINHVEFSPCGRMLASCSLDGSVIIWDIEVMLPDRLCNVKSYHQTADFYASSCFCRHSLERKENEI